jgi:hypothetical protein
LSDYSGLFGNDKLEDQLQYSNSSVFLPSPIDQGQDTNQPSYQSSLPLYFNCTSVVDLKPFDQSERNLIKNGEKLPIIKRNLVSVNQNRKYLIKKNLRVYEPIHEAAVMSKIDELRQKLATTRSQKSPCSITDTFDEKKDYLKIIEIYKDSLNSINYHYDSERKFSCNDSKEENNFKYFDSSNDHHQTTINIFNGISKNIIPRLHGSAPGSSLLRCCLNKMNPLISSILKQERIQNFQKTSKNFPQSFHEPNFQFSQTKVQNLVRQSTRNRFSNIYKTNDIENGDLKTFSPKTAFSSFENMNQYASNTSLNLLNFIETGHKTNENFDSLSPKQSKFKPKLTKSKTIFLHCKNAVQSNPLQNKKEK